MDGECVPKDVRELISSYQLSAFVTQVCKYAATSKEEWEEQCKLWPSSFHPPTYNIEGISGFSEEGSKSILNFMKSAIELATSRAELVNAAVIVDPSSDHVISSACDEICSWQPSHGENYTENSSQSENFPSHPFVIGCSSNAKKLQSDASLDEPESLYLGVLCLNPWWWYWRHLSSSSPCYWHPLRHAAMVAIEYYADSDRRLNPATDRMDDEPIQVDSPTAGAPAKRIKMIPANGAHSVKVRTDSIHPDPARPYLCTGYDIYLAWEPCVMCAMALVHQRMRRIFYAFPNPNTGALGSVHRLQGEKSLNHHYAVFQVKLPDSILKARLKDPAATEETDLTDA